MSFFVKTIDKLYRLWYNICIVEMRPWRNRQTRWFQVPVGVTRWRFKSSRAHQRQSRIFIFRDCFFLFCSVCLFVLFFLLVSFAFLACFTFLRLVLPSLPFAAGPASDDVVRYLFRRSALVVGKIVRLEETFGDLAVLVYVEMMPEVSLQIYCNAEFPVFLSYGYSVHEHPKPRIAYRSLREYAQSFQVVYEHGRQDLVSAQPRQVFHYHGVERFPFGLLLKLFYTAAVEMHSAHVVVGRFPDYLVSFRVRVLLDDLRNILSLMRKHIRYLDELIETKTFVFFISTHTPRAGCD